jgi:hypothetical protein
MNIVNYIEKGWGLHELVRKSGYNLEQINGQWYADFPLEVQSLIDNYKLSDAIAYRQTESLRIAKSLRDKAVEGISSGEMAGWPIKLAEARAFMLDPTASTPMLSAEAHARGISVSDLVTKVGGNSSKFAALEAAIGGIDGKHRDALSKLTNFEDINSYDLTTGWPEV